MAQADRFRVLLLPLLWPARADAGGNCMPHCANPCDQLSGDLNHECGGCDAATLCWHSADALLQQAAS